MAHRKTLIMQYKKKSEIIFSLVVNIFFPF